MTRQNFEVRQSSHELGGIVAEDDIVVEEANRQQEHRTLVGEQVINQHTYSGIEGSRNHQALPQAVVLQNTNGIASPLHHPPLPEATMPICLHPDTTPVSSCQDCLIFKITTGTLLLDLLACIAWWLYFCTRLPDVFIAAVFLTPSAMLSSLVSLVLWFRYLRKSLMYSLYGYKSSSPRSCSPILHDSTAIAPVRINNTNSNCQNCLVFKVTMAALFLDVIAFVTWAIIIGEDSPLIRLLSGRKDATHTMEEVGVIRIAEYCAPAIAPFAVMASLASVITWSRWLILRLCHGTDHEAPGLGNEKARNTLTQGEAAV